MTISTVPKDGETIDACAGASVERGQERVGQGMTSWATQRTLGDLVQDALKEELGRNHALITSENRVNELRGYAICLYSSRINGDMIQLSDRDKPVMQIRRGDHHPSYLPACSIIYCR